MRRPGLLIVTAGLVGLTAAGLGILSHGGSFKVPAA